LRERLMPLVTLADVLRVADTENADGPELSSEAGVRVDHDPEAKFVVVAQVGTQRFGIIVDNIFDTEEIVVKPVASILRNLSVYSGNTILGDGSVIMIIDPTGLARMVSENMDERPELEEEQEEADAANRSVAEQVSLLLFRAGGQEPKAVPLSLVTRLEEI